jgi:GTP cyclohydrolase I
MHIQITMNYHLIPNRTATSKKQKEITNVGNDVEQSEYWYIVVRNIKFCICCGKMHMVPQILK